LTNNALQECQCGRIDPTSYLDQINLKYDRKQNHDRSKKSDIKTTAIKDRNEEATRKVLK
jgi:hypothetical protein